MPKRKIKRLEDLSIREVSSVDEPANEDALVMLLKRKDTQHSEDDSPQVTDTDHLYKSVLPSDLDTLLADGLDAVCVEKAGPSPLQRVSAWLKMHAEAERIGKTAIAKGLEADVPSTATIDLAISELTKSVRREGESYFAAYDRAMHSRFGAQLYSLRDEVDRAGNSGSAFAAHRQYQRDEGLR